MSNNTSLIETNEAFCLSVKDLGPVLTGIACLMSALDQNLRPSYYCYHEALDRPESEVEKECGIELSCYTDGSIDVNMLHFLDLRTCVKKTGGFSIRDFANECCESLGAFDVDEEVRCHMEDNAFRQDFSYLTAALTFTAWDEKLIAAISDIQTTLEILIKNGIDVDAKISMGLAHLVAHNEIIEDGRLYLVQQEEKENNQWAPLVGGRYKTSDIIAALERAVEIHGDLPFEICDFNNGIHYGTVSIYANTAANGGCEDGDPEAIGLQF